MILCYRGLCWIMGFRVRLIGRLIKDRPLMLISNHLSLWDMPLIGGCISLGFVAKGEISHIPFISWIIHSTGNVFIDRNQRATQNTLNQLEQSLNSRNLPLCLFPEGTTGHGLDILAFKSSAFSLVQKNPDLKIQMMVLKLTRVNGQTPSSQNIQDLAWPHTKSLWRFFRDSLQYRQIEFTLHILHQVPAEDLADRKIMAQYCYTWMRDKYQDS